MRKVLYGIGLGFFITALVISAVIWRVNSKPEPVVSPKPIPEVTLTFLEGWKIEDYAEFINKQERLRIAKSDFLSAVENFNVDSYPFLASKNLEGFLFPDTYRFFEDVTPDKLIRTLLDNFTKRFEQLGVSVNKPTYYINNYPGLIFNLRELVTLASIVEKESGKNYNEKQIVAGVFLNRLERKMPLESDATVNYVSGKNTPSPTWDDTKIDSPYNTYVYPGLPPGPICNPSLDSIKSVLNPEKTSYYFFLHKQPGGEVVFSKTFEEHVQNKFKFLK